MGYGRASKIVAMGNQLKKASKVKVRGVVKVRIKREKERKRS